MSGPDLRQELQEFVFYEARLIDERRFDEWGRLFADDGYYWVPASPNQETPFDHVSLFYDDKSTIESRVARLQHPQIHVQVPASRTCHLISNISIDKPGQPADQFVINSSLLVLEYRPGSNQRLFGGTCRHSLRRTAGGFEIVEKRVNLVNCDGTFGALAVPI